MRGVRGLKAEALLEVVPEDVKKLASDKPLFPLEPKMMARKIPNMASNDVLKSRGPRQEDFIVKVVVEALTTSRNTSYRSP
jgi:hypothetical protein